MRPIDLARALHTKRRMTSKARLLSFSAATAAVIAIGSYATPAHAGLEACGDIYVAANAECEVLVEGGCVSQCEPVRFEAACAAELHANCEGQCNADFAAECSASCEGGCVADCEAQPAEFNCQAACQADCTGQCDASCSSGDSECRAACEGTCSAECSANCEATPPMASCEAQCEASCEGSCEARANIDCQVDCQADGFAMCKADLQGGCETQCTRPEGALFCDGQYVDVGGNLEECIDSLRAELNVEVSGYAEAECTIGECTGEAGGAISCAVDEPSNQPWWLGVGIFGVLGVVAMRRRF